MQLNIIILAAGHGSRMLTKLPKILHCIGNIPILQHVINAAKQLKPHKIIIVYGDKKDEIQDAINAINPNNDFIWAHQDKQLGTAHAVMATLAQLHHNDISMVLSADVPLITHNTLQQMLDKYNDNIVLLTSKHNDPTGYGRIVRNNEHKIIAIIEDKDASNQIKAITEINNGIYIFSNKFLLNYLPKLTNNNQQQEYYITELIALAVKSHHQVISVTTNNLTEGLGVNNKIQLEQLERLYQLQMANTLLVQGVTLLDKSRIDIRGNITIGYDCVIDINCLFEGDIIIGNNVNIGMGSILKNVTIDDDVIIKPYSIIDGATIKSNCQIGPFARIRPNTTLDTYTHIGNFVETKNANIGHNSKVNHLTYVGDAIIGNNVNIGAGSVTCNYDGTNKHTTIIQNNVFVGSGVMMVAPVTLGENSIIGAGSTITKNAPSNELTIARAKQVTILGYIKRKLLK